MLYVLLSPGQRPSGESGGTICNKEHGSRAAAVKLEGVGMIFAAPGGGLALLRTDMKNMGQGHGGDK